MAYIHRCTQWHNSACIGDNNMNTSALINDAMIAGLRNAMLEEQYKIPTNSGFSMELMTNVK